MSGSDDDPELRALRLENQRLENNRLRKEIATRINWNVVIPVIVAIVGLAPSAYVAALNSRTQLTIEQLKAETALIIEAIKTNPEQGFKNLKFLILSGKLSDPDHRMLTLIDKGQGPNLQCPGAIVWADISTHEFHIPGESWFPQGHGQGAFLCLEQALALGFKHGPDATGTR
jgi:hypothetical protein